MLSTVNIPIQTTLSARALKCAITQALAIINSTVTKWNKKAFIAKKNNNAILQSWIDTHLPTRPLIDKNTFKAELNSMCMKYITTNTSFDGWIKLVSIGKSFGHIYLLN